MKTIFYLVLIFAFPSFAVENLSCPEGTYRVKGHNRRAYYRADGTFVKASYVNTYCKEVSAAYKFWSSKIQAGKPTDWTLKNELPAIWTEEERERILEALSELPEFLWSHSARGFYRFLKSRDMENPASQIKGQIAIYDVAFDKKYVLARVLAHELAHFKYEDVSEDENKDYEKATGWIRTVRARTVVWTGRKAGYVANDGEFSPGEDFANNIEYYLFDPNKLKTTTPSAFEWIQKHYGDKLKIRKR